MQRTYQLNDIPATRAEGALAARLRREGVRRRFPAGALIQQQGDRGVGLWLVESGTVSLCRFAPDGAVTVYGVLGAGDLFGELAHFAQVPRQVDAVADGDAVLIRIGPALVDRLLRDDPAFAPWLLKSLANQLRAALDRIDGAHRFAARARIARALADMARRDGPILALTQQGLGELVGVSRVTAGQVLRQLEADGLIALRYRCVEVRDPARLAALAG